MSALHGPVRWKTIGSRQFWFSAPPWKLLLIYTVTRHDPHADYGKCRGPEICQLEWVQNKSLLTGFIQSPSSADTSIDKNDFKSDLARACSQGGSRLQSSSYFQTMKCGRGNVAMCVCVRVCVCVCGCQCWGHDNLKLPRPNKVLDCNSNQVAAAP